MARPPSLMRAFDPPPVTLWRRSERPAASTTATRGRVEPWPSSRRWTPARSAGPATLGSAVPEASGPAGPTDGADPRISVSPDPGGDFNESGILPFISPKATKARGEGHVALFRPGRPAGRWATAAERATPNLSRAVR